MIPDSIIETDRYLEEVRRIQPASVLRQLSPVEGAHGTSSVACWDNLLQPEGDTTRNASRPSARLILQQIWIRRRRSDVEKQLAYAVITITASKQHRDVRREKYLEIITYYNETKSGVDVLDKLVRTYYCKRASSGWTVAFFLNMLDIVEYNAVVRWITFDPNWQQGKPHFFCTSWLHNYSMVTRLHVSGHRHFWGLQNVGVYRNAHVDQESSLQRLACLHHWVV